MSLQIEEKFILDDFFNLFLSVQNEATLKKVGIIALLTKYTLNQKLNYFQNNCKSIHFLIGRSKSFKNHKNAYYQAFKNLDIMRFIRKKSARFSLQIESLPSLFYYLLLPFFTGMSVMSLKLK